MSCARSAKFFRQLTRDVSRSNYCLIADNGNSLRLDAGTEFRVDLTPIGEKLSRWLVTQQAPVAELSSLLWFLLDVLGA